MSGNGENEVVISGLAGCFPGSDNVDELADNLFNGVDPVTDKNCRWKLNDKLGVPNATGKIKNASKFDAAHFGIHRKQAESLDPMTCLMMERTFEAIYDAGINPASLKGRNVGVYMGSTFSEANNVFDFQAAGNGFGVMGHNRSMLASRLSYYLDVSGPSYVSLSSWCCGLTALSLALRDVREGRCSAALVGTPNLTLFPAMSWHLAELGLLSRDGKSKSFDSAADGWGRSDAVVVLFLQKRKDAKRIYASVVHSDVHFFGDQQSFLRPERVSVAKLLQEFYDSCGVDPKELAFLEADGSGVKSMDREELNGVEEALLRQRRTPLLLGSVKSNLGHTESSSALVSIVKILIAMKTGYIPGNLHYHHPAPGIPALTEDRLKVVTEKTAWSGGYAGINSIGIDGNFGHVLLKSYDEKKVKTYDGLPRLVVASSRTEEGLQRLLKKVVSIPFDAEYIRLLHDVHATNIVGHIYRGFAIIDPDKPSEIKVEHFPGKRRPIWFVYSGMGSQWPGMGAHLMRLPVFRASINKCHAALEPRGLDLRHIITTPDPSIFDNILHCFVGIAAVQIGLTDVLTKLGLQADGLIGHSVGEMGCAYADGCFTAEEMILAAYARGKASIEAKLVKGMMAAVGLGFNEIKDTLPPEIEVACHNGPGSCSISGPAKELENFVADLKSKGVFAKTVDVANIAYHSRYVRPAAPYLLNYLKEILPVAKPRSARWISTSVPEDRWDTPLAQTSSPEYHTNNLLSSVLFEEGSRHIPSNAITIEVAPHGLLQAILRRSLGEGCTNTSLTQRGHEDGVELLLAVIGKLYTLGLHPQVAEIYPAVQFPVSQGTPFISPIIGWEHDETWPLANFLENELSPGEREVELSMSQGETRLYAGHVIDGRVVLPAAMYLKLVWEGLAVILQEKFVKLAVVFEDVFFYDSLYIPERGSLKLYILVQRGTGNFEVTEGNRILATGRIKVPENVDTEFTALGEVPRSGTQLSADDVYRELEHRGYRYCGQFRSITNALVNRTGSVCRIKWHDNWVSFISSMIQQSILQTGEQEQVIQSPKSIRRLVINPTKHSPKDTDFEVVSNLDTSIIHGGAVEIQGLKTRSLSSPSNKTATLQIDTPAFVPYGNTRLQSIKDFLNVCIQIAIENSQPMIKSNNCKVTVIEKLDEHSLIEQIEECLRSYPHIEIDVKMSFSNGPKHEGRSGSFLVATNPSLINHGSLFLGSSGGFLLTRVNDTDSWAFAPDLAIVIEQQFGNGKFLLLRKICSEELVPIVVKVSATDDEWLTQLRRSLQAKRRVLLVADGEHPSGVTSIVNRISKEPDSELVRFVFVLDKSAPPFSVAEQWYQPQLQRGLVVNVFQDQHWGSYRLLPISGDTATADHGLTPLPSLSLEGVELSYLGLNKRETTFNSNQYEIGHMDFSGRTGAHRWVMGIARSGDSKPDPLLTWSVPDSWGLEDSATVPFAYATAYYALVIIGSVKHGERVLIHAGTSSIGQAAIAVATAAGCDVFTTVATMEQRGFLIKRFPELLENHIYYSEDLKFESQVKLATGNNGVELVLNCWSGERLQASVRCLGMMGRFIQLGKADMEQNGILGMSMFVRSRAFFGLAGDNLFNATTEDKLRLRDLVQTGIVSGVVQSLDRSVFLCQQYDKALGMLADEERIGKVLVNVREANRKSNMRVEMTQTLRFDSRGSCLIVGGTTEFWLDLAEWVLQRGARKLIVVQQTSPITNYISRRVNLLRTYHKATVVLSANTAATSAGAEKLVEEANTYGPLGSVFMLPMERANDGKKGEMWPSGIDVLRNLDCATRHSGVQHFLCLLCEGAESVCLARTRAGLHGLAVHWSGGSEELKPVLPTLHQLLGADTKHAVVLRITQHKRTTDNNQSSGKGARLDSFLPASLPDLLLLGSDVMSKAKSAEMPSLSPGLQYVKEVPPVFLVPGIQGSTQKVLQPLARCLMYPAIGLQLPDCGSIQEMAASLVKDVRHMQPVGPYNLVGDSWGGAVALELAKSLEAQGEKTQVFLLEGAPETAQATARNLGDGDHLQTNLICRLLNLDSKEINEEILGMPSWESRLSKAISLITVSSGDEAQLLKTAITATHSRITALLQYKPQGPLVTGLVTLVRPRTEEEDTCSLIQFCKNTVSVHLVGNDHAAMLSSMDTANIISDSVIV